MAERGWEYGRWASVAASILAALAGLVSFFVFDTKTSPPLPVPPPPDTVPTSDVKRLQDQVDRLRARVGALAAPPDSAVVASQLSDIRASIASLSKRAAALEDAILNDPEKALRIPLLSMQLDAVRVSGETSITALSQDIDRQYDLMKWLMGTFVLGLGGLIFSQILAVAKPARGS